MHVASVFDYDYTLAPFQLHSLTHSRRKIFTDIVYHITVQVYYLKSTKRNGKKRLGKAPYF